MRQVKLKQVKLKIDTSFSENRDAARAILYLKSGEINLRDGIEISLACLFAPIGAAVAGASQSEVKTKCEMSRTIFETYMNLAMSRAELREEDKSLSVETKLLNSTTHNNADTSNLSSPSQSEEKREGDKSPTLTKINFDEEEF